VAFGSAKEARISLRVAHAWGYISDAELARVDAGFDRICAILYRCVHAREDSIARAPAQ
jgi:hypothetical protein